MTITEEQSKKLREPFPATVVGKLPRIICGACSKNKFDKHCDKHQRSKCRECGNYITTAHMHLDYIGHATVTDRLLQVDPEWSWEPMAFGPDGLPQRDQNGGLWIRLTVAGVTRIGYGDAQGKEGPDAVKEAIGDALRNAAMRFGVALDLWSKTPLEDQEPTPAQPPARRQQTDNGPVPSPADRAKAAVEAILAAETADAVEKVRGRVAKSPIEVRSYNVAQIVPAEQRGPLGIRDGESVTASQLADLKLDVLEQVAEAKKLSVPA